MLLVAGVPLSRSSGWEVEKSTSEAALKFVNDTPLLHKVPIIAIIEAAPGIAASNISKHMDDYASIHQMPLNYMCECEDAGVGVLKTKQINVEYRYCLEFVLKNRSLARNATVATLHPTNTGEKEVERLGEMMRSYHYDDKKHMITSKMDNSPDDILSALNQLLYFGLIFWTTAKYEKLRDYIVAHSQCDFPFVTNGAFRPKLGL